MDLSREEELGDETSGWSLEQGLELAKKLIEKLEPKKVSVCITIQALLNYFPEV